MIVGWWVIRVVLFVMGTMAIPAFAQVVGPSEEQSTQNQSPETTDGKPQTPDWHYGGFIDLGYSLDFNYPENHLFRNRGTTPRVNELDLNMGGIYVRKDPRSNHAGEWKYWARGARMLWRSDSEPICPTSTGPTPSATSAASEYVVLAPVGTGLTLQAGLFNSMIGYESLYAKDNFNYTRAWIADYSPYLMFGANAQYAFNEKWSGAFFIINDYFHLQNANNMPSYGTQVAYKPGTSLLLKETIYYGPDQADTSMRYWRLFSDSIAEWKVNDDVTLVGEYQVGTQEMAVPGNPRVFYMGAAFPMRWHIAGPWSVALRPEVYWDRSGLMTGAEQFIRAVTTTAEYKFPYKWTNMIARLEYRYDESTGSGGGFFKGNEIAPGVIGLTPAQHMLIFGLIWTLDSP